MSSEKSLSGQWANKKSLHVWAMQEYNEFPLHFYKIARYDYAICKQVVCALKAECVQNLRLMTERNL